MSKQEQNDSYKSQQKVSFFNFLAELPNFIAVTVSAIISGSLIVWMDFVDSLGNVLNSGLVIYKRGCYSLRFFLYDEGDWLTEFPIGTPRPPTNVSASLHHSAFDSASWDKSLLPFHELI